MQAALALGTCITALRSALLPLVVAGSAFREKTAPPSSATNVYTVCLMYSVAIFARLWQWKVG